MTRPFYDSFDDIQLDELFDDIDKLAAEQDYNIDDEWDDEDESYSDLYSDITIRDIIANVDEDLALINAGWVKGLDY